MVIETVLEPPPAPDLAQVDVAFSGKFPTPREIDISFFSYKSRRSTQLVSNISSDNYMRARRAWMDFDFADVIYVTTIKVYASGYESYHSMELSFVPYLGRQDDPVRINATFAGDHFLFQVADFTKGFGLRPNEPMFKTAQLTKIEVFGVERQYVKGFVEFVDNIEIQKAAARSSVTTYFKEADSAYERMKSAEQALVDLEETLGKRTSELADLDTKVATAIATAKRAQEEIEVASDLRP